MFNNFKIDGAFVCVCIVFVVSLFVCMCSVCLGCQPGSFGTHVGQVHVTWEQDHIDQVNIQ